MISAHRAETPREAWEQLILGNKRFISGEPAHPRQDVDHRDELAAGQRPFATLFGCSDSRLSAEIIFDLGLGDLFVVRNAGQTISQSVVGSLEYAVSNLGVHLILVLAHDDCGAVRIAMDSRLDEAQPLPSNIRAITDAIQPAIDRVLLANATSDINEIFIDDVGRNTCGTQFPNCCHRVNLSATPSQTVASVSSGQPTTCVRGASPPPSSLAISTKY